MNYMAMAGWKAGVINAAKGVIAAFNAVCAANPYVLIIAAIVALVAAFIYLWNNCEEFRQFWIDLWESIKEIAIAVCVNPGSRISRESLVTVTLYIFLTRTQRIRSYLPTSWGYLQSSSSM